MQGVPYTISSRNRIEFPFLDGSFSHEYSHCTVMMKKVHMQGSQKDIHVEGIDAFRKQVKQARETNRMGWEESRKLIRRPQLSHTLAELARKVQQSSLHETVKTFVLESLPQATVERIADHPNEQLKELTGLPTTKAVRALCLTFGVGGSNAHDNLTPRTPPSQIEEILRNLANPYDVLLSVDSPSVLDLGAGDLTFEQELVDLYLPKLQGQHQPLVLHAVDRLQPGSRVGGVYHVDPHRKKRLQGFADKEFGFRFWGGIDLADLSTVKGLRPHYSLVTCHAPANPTFSFEPTRLSSEVIRAQLTKTRGEFRKRRVDGEEVLEVSHEGRILTFPPWKFDVAGPLTLVDVMIRRGSVCILSAIDGEVFWETLAQLLADERYRPADVLFSPHTIEEVFGSIYTTLTRLPLGGRVSLSELAELRKVLPRVTPCSEIDTEEYGLGYVEIRRGATFEGMPSSFTARQFAEMKEEEPPWWIILVPTTGQNS